ncbi:MAG TPA: cytochrome c [Vicinamibacterales bacterium]|jgi:hypothetical protein|nr:cytochrome c [Vicinamibacterales bacterium]
MRRALSAIVAFMACGQIIDAHGVGSTPTWNREISRLIYQRCATCHRPGGTTFSLMTYSDAQPRANEIKDAVLARRMPPWGAVKGFGSFRNDLSLSQEQIETISRWVDGGIRRGNNPLQAPKQPSFAPVASHDPVPSLRVSGPFTLAQPIALDGLLPERVPPGQSLRIVAALPNGSVQPLVWLHDFDSRFSHPFMFRAALHLPAGTTIHGVPPTASIGLLTVAR